MTVPAINPVGWWLFEDQHTHRHAVPFHRVALSTGHIDGMDYLTLDGLDTERLTVRQFHGFTTDPAKVCEFLGLKPL